MAKPKTIKPADPFKDFVPPVYEVWMHCRINGEPYGPQRIGSERTLEKAREAVKRYEKSQEDPTLGDLLGFSEVESRRYAIFMATAWERVE